MYLQDQGSSLPLEASCPLFHNSGGQRAPPLIEQKLVYPSPYFNPFDNLKHICFLFYGGLQVIKSRTHCALRLLITMPTVAGSMVLSGCSQDHLPLRSFTKALSHRGLHRRNIHYSLTHHHSPQGEAAASSEDVSLAGFKRIQCP